MKLYLHIGIEKTGSSFIQSSFAKNREYLKCNEIWFPRGGNRENDMLEGRVSPGNARDLHNALKSEDYKQVENLLQTFKSETLNRNCNALLLSNELLLEVLSKKSVWQEFLKILNALEIKLESVLLILRDPVNQALSLYKHRAKNGNIAALPEWLEQSYKYHESLNNFKEILSEYSNVFLIRGYHRNGIKLLQIFYADWLKIQVPKEEYSHIVNPSLNLSELRLLAEIAKNDKQIADSFYNYMIKVSSKDKSDDTYIMKWAYNQIEISLSKYNKTWETYNSYLPESEKLKLCSDQNETYEFEETYSFNKNQLNNLANYITSQISLKSILNYRYQKLKLKLIEIIKKTY